MRRLGTAVLALGLLAPVSPAQAAPDPVITSVPSDTPIDMSGTHNGGGDLCVGANHAVTAGGSVSRTLRVSTATSIDFFVSSQTNKDLSAVLVDADGHEISCGGRTPIHAGQDYAIYVTWYAETESQGPADAVLHIERTPQVGVGVVRNGRWYLAGRPGAPATRAFTFGSATDTDGVIDGTPYFRRGSSWYLYGQHPFSYGGSDAAPVVGDWDGRNEQAAYGQGLQDDPRPGVVRAGHWAVSASLYSSTPPKTTKTFAFGGAGDVFVVGDWNADGISTPGVYRSGRWFFSNTLGGPATSACTFGSPGDVPVVGDWNGDGIDNPGVFRNGHWYTLDRCGGAVRSFVLGAKGDKPVVGRWR